MKPSCSGQRKFVSQETHPASEHSHSKEVIASLHFDLLSLRTYQMFKFPKIIHPVNHLTMSNTSDVKEAHLYFDSSLVILI